MKMIARLLACLFGVPLMVFAGVFAIGEITGHHSIKYDRDGTWLCWVPRDRMHGECTGVLPWVPASVLDEITASERGYIRCRNGHWEAGNIDIDLSKAKLSRPYLLEFKPEECPPEPLQ